MEKKCFIIMPTGDPDGYAQGHFDRVYQYIIVPACKSAGFSPMRANDASTYDTPLDIIKNMIEGDMAICDLSSKNSNALYGFAIRQALSLPVTLVKDLKTGSAYMQEFGSVEYDDSLRIDTVQREIETLSETLTKAYANKLPTDSLLNRLDIGTPKLPAIEIVPAPAPEPVYQEEVAKKEESHLPLITPIPSYVGDPITEHGEIDKLKIGDSVFHINYGKGEIKAINKMAKDKIAKVQFESGTKLLVLTTSGSFRMIRV